MRCLCKVCSYGDQVLLVRNYGNTAAKQALIDELYANMCSIDNDNDVWQAIFEGTWPNARWYGETIIKRCNALKR